MKMREIMEVQKPTRTFTVVRGDQREVVTAHQTASGKWMYYSDDEPWLIDGERLIHKGPEGWVETGTVQDDVVTVGEPQPKAARVPRVYPDDVSLEDAQRKLRRERFPHATLRRVRLARTSMNSGNKYFIESWGVFVGGKYHGNIHLRRDGRLAWIPGAGLTQPEWISDEEFPIGQGERKPR
jgi:hypothetical protein